MTTRIFNEVDLQPALIQINDQIVALGDPHIGRQFKTGVPVHRRGEREQHQFEVFKHSLNNFPSTVKYHVCMGDLFDKFRMPEEIILAVATAYTAAALAHPEVTYVLLSGNHDMSRDKEKNSAFEVLQLILEPYENIKVVSEETLVMDNLAFVPWTPFMNSVEHTEDLPEGIEFVFGHWDFLDFGDDKHNCIPYQALAGKCSAVVTGHYHKRGIHLINNAFGMFDILVTGSMQPYAHGEDIFEDTYVTMTRAEVETTLAMDPEYFHDMCLRVLIAEGEAPLDNINCLSLTHKREAGTGKDMEVKLDEFSLEDVFRKTFKDNEVSQPTTDRLWQKVAARNI